MEWSDVWRIINGLLAVVAFILLLTEVIRVHVVLSRRMRILSYSLLTFVATGAVGAIENILESNVFGFRDVMVSVGCIWAIYALKCIPPTITREYIAKYKDIDNMRE